ncbi:ATP-binding cassette domain-containing protein [Azotobacter sp. CWF10]
MRLSAHGPEGIRTQASHARRATDGGTPHVRSSHQRLPTFFFLAGRNTRAVRSSFDLGASRIGLVAPNGAGKSTLLRLLAGELQPVSGSIRLYGAVGYLQQNLVLDKDASVADVLGVATKLRALDAILAGEADVAEFDLLDGDWNLRERIAAALGRLGMGEVSLQRRLATFSGGEAMSLALAAKLLQGPDVLLLDEPTNHLDRGARRCLRDALAKWPGCVLVASHDRELLDDMDQIAELEPSRLRLYGGGFGFYRQAVETERQAAEQRVHHLRGEVRREKRRCSRHASAPSGVPAPHRATSPMPAWRGSWPATASAPHRSRQARPGKSMRVD